MPLNRLRRVLTNKLSVQVESTPAIVAAVQNAAANRQLLNPKVAAVYPPLTGTRTIAVRPIALLRKIGELTTPKQINLARLSASWATRRYFWAIHDHGVQAPAQPEFYLSRDARMLERHQKTLLSDEFGIGFAGLIAEQLLGTDNFVDIEYAVSNPQSYFGATAAFQRKPDYLMWGTQMILFVIECKGCQTSEASVVKQLRRGLEQLPSISFPGQAAVNLVIATHLRGRSTRIVVLDPPSDDPPSEDTRPDGEPHSPDRPRDMATSIERTGRKAYAVRDPDKFREKLQAGTNIALLRWAAQHASAKRFESALGYERIDTEWPDAPIDLFSAAGIDYLGVATPLAPELGLSGPKVFRGLRADVMDNLKRGAATQAVPPLAQPQPYDDPLISTGPLGTCLAIRDMQM